MNAITKSGHASRAVGKRNAGTMWTRAQIDFAKAERLKGTPTREIAHKLGATREALRGLFDRLMQRGEIEPLEIGRRASNTNGPLWTQAEVNLIKDGLARGLAPKAIHQELSARAAGGVEGFRERSKMSVASRIRDLKAGRGHVVSEQNPLGSHLRKPEGRKKIITPGTGMGRGNNSPFKKAAEARKAAEAQAAMNADTTKAKPAEAVAENPTPLAYNKQRAATFNWSGSQLRKHHVSLSGWDFSGPEMALQSDVAELRQWLEAAEDPSWPPARDLQLFEGLMTGSKASCQEEADRFNILARPIKNDRGIVTTGGAQALARLLRERAA